MSVGQVSCLRQSRYSDDGENGSVNLWNLASTRSGCTFVAHIGDGNREIEPFPVREGVPTPRMSVPFTPVLPLVCGTERWSLIENESCCTETDEGENGEKSENPVNEDIHTTQRLGVTTKLGEESAGVRHKIWFRLWQFLLFDGFFDEACPYLFDRFAGRNVMNGNDKKRYGCEEWG